MIYLLTGPVRSGKTTALIEWSKGRNDIYGILTPDVGGKRVFMNIETKELFSMEAEANETSVMVGRFLFSKKNFDRAVNIIRNALNKEGWLVIDEAGPLELSGDGFAPVLKELFKIRKIKIVVVVRNGLAEQIENYFELRSTEVILISTTSVNQLL